MLHVAYDVVTPWGTLLLYPFSLERFALDWLFIVDFVTWLAPIAALVAARRHPARARVAAALFLAAIALYTGLSGWVHREAFRATVQADREVGRAGAEVQVFPRLGAPWRWRGLAAAAGAPEPRIAQYAVSGIPPEPRLEARITRGFDDPWARRALATREGQAYLWWARVPVARVDPQNERVVVTLADLRYTRALVAAAETWVPFSVRFTFDREEGALRDVRW